VADLAQAVTWHRQVAALAAAADRAGVADADLPAVRARLAAQQSRLAEAAARSGAPLPALVPTPSEIASAGPALGDLSDAAVGRTIRTMWSTLDAVDAALGQPAPVATAGQRIGTPPAAGPAPEPVAAAAAAGPQPIVPQELAQRVGRNLVLRNAAIYAGFATGVLVAQAALFVALDENTALPLSAPLCLLILPALAWLAGFLTIGVVFRSPPGGPPLKRNPRLGAVICLVPDLLLCAIVGALFVSDRLSG
jgi:hypothetical protein